MIAWFKILSLASIMLFITNANVNVGQSEKIVDKKNDLLSNFAPNLGTTERISVTDDGIPGEDYSSHPSISADGRYVAFQSSAKNFITNVNLYQVFVKDRSSGEIKLVSVSSTGVLANSQSGSPSISGDGQFVAFTSMGNNLIDDDTNFCHDVFLHDMQSGETLLASIADNGLLGNGCSGAGAGPHTISFNGRFIVFDSTSDNLVSGDTNGKVDVFVHDRQAGTTELISVANDGTQAGQTERVSVASDGTEGGSSYFDYAYSDISADGRYIAFVSPSNNLVADDDNGDYDVFVRDRELDITERVSIKSDGTQGNGASSQFDSPTISDDGRYITFQSNASNLVNGDSNNASDIFLHDRQTGETSLISIANDGSHGNSESFNPSITANGRMIAFDSVSTNFVCGDTPTGDIYVHDRQGNGKSISGNIRSVLGLPFSGVIISDGDGLITTTDSSGNYSFGELISCEYIIYSNLDGHYFKPSSIVINIPPGTADANFAEVYAVFLPIHIK
jgi:Tol biopolymer transport system component